MDISKRDSKVLKGIAIISMLMLHLFCRKENLPYTPLIWIGETPLIYYLGLFGDICVSIFCFISGYAHYIQSSNKITTRERYIHLLRFFIKFLVIVLLSSLIGLISRNPTLPGNWKEFIFNCLTIKNSYNGAWWYVNTYLLIVLLQPIFYRFTRNCPAWFVLISGFAFYTIGYGIRFWNWFATDIPVFAWVITHIGLLGTSFFPYIIGMLFCKKQIIGTLHEMLRNIHNIYIYILTVFTFCMMIVMHGIIPSLFVAVITAIVTICLMCICPIPKWLAAIFEYLGDHSTNIWLTHMFFYMNLFNGLVFRVKYPILIFLFMLSLSLISSYIINLICKPILKNLR